MPLRLEPVHDAASARSWRDVAARCDPLDHPGAPLPTQEEAVQLALHPGSAERALLLNASDADDVVGSVMLWLPLRDNTKIAHTYVRLVPERRGRGLGNELVAAAIGVARSEGRSTMTGHISATEPSGEAGRAIAKRLGGTPALESIRSGLDVRTLTDAALEDLGTALLGRHAERYEPITWVDRVSDELVDDTAYLMSRMSTDAPLGELDLEAEQWDAARYRDKEREALASGRTRLVAGAIERSSGRLVAYTDIGIASSEPVVGEQWDTIVDPQHRGHRLGLLVKLANLRQLRARFPATESVQTYNATENAHMRAVNAQLGFVELERSVAWQFSI